MADLPIKELGDQAPEYNRPFRDGAKPAVIDAASVDAAGRHHARRWRGCLAAPDLCSKRWVWEQYDHIILGNTVQRPGGDAAVVRVENGPKGLALTTDVTPRYCEADPFEGGKQAVAECWRNLTAVGATPLAITDNLNFGNPERPEIMGQFVGAIRGIAEACKALDFPVVSGNVSLYNETNGKAILPTPSIGGVGLLERFHQIGDAGLQARRRGDPADRRRIRHGSASRCICARSAGARRGRRRRSISPPRRRNGDCVRALIADGAVSAVHDVSDGGLLVAVAEMAMASGIGATLLEGGTPAHGFWFGEDQARYVVTVPAARTDAVIARIEAAGVMVARLGTTGGDALTLAGEQPLLVPALREQFEGWLPAYMAGAPA